MILDLGDRWTVADGRRPAAVAERFGSFAAGLTEGPVLVEHPGRARCLQVDLTALGARRLLGVPMRELASRTVALEDVLGRSAGELVERLADAPGWDARFAIVETDPALDWARAAATCGYFDQAHLAREVRDLTALTPTALRAERVNSVQDGASIAV